MCKRPKPRVLMLSITFLSLLVMLLSACGAQGTVVTPKTDQPVKGGTWVDDVPAAPGSLLPQGSDTTYSTLIDQAIYTPLFYGDQLGQVHPGLVSEIPTLANHAPTPTLTTCIFKFP